MFVLLGTTTASGVPGAQVGGSGVGESGFWKSFGSQIKNDGWQLLIP